MQINALRNLDNRKTSFLVSLMTTSGYNTEASILNFDFRVEMCVHENQMSAHAPSMDVPPDPTLLEFVMNLATENHHNSQCFGLPIIEQFANTLT